MTDCLVGSHPHHAHPRNFWCFSTFPEGDGLCILSATFPTCSVSLFLGQCTCATIDYPKPHVSPSEGFAGSVAWNPFSTASLCLFTSSSVMSCLVLNSFSKSKSSYLIKYQSFLVISILTYQWQVFPHLHAYTSLNTLPPFLQSLQY